MRIITHIMKGLRPRDYFVAALIILGIPALWFLIIIGLTGVASLGLSFSIVVVISFIVYLVLKHRQTP
jgi:amino acid transporter